MIMPIELVRELPHVRVDPGECREGGGAYPYVDEPVRVGVWNPRVAPIRISEVLLHCFSLLTLSLSHLSLQQPPPSSMDTSSGIEDIAIDEAAEDPTAEESGWTAYLEDFSASCPNGSSSSSMVSDAAWNGSDGLRRLNFNILKKKIPRKCSYDDDLEDTASSPVNSPKVSSMKQMEVNYRRMDDVAPANFLEKQAVSNNFLKHDRESERTQKNIVMDTKNIDHYAELRKRGLCLVPMSTLINYLG